jgi:hypothetical protein
MSKDNGSVKMELVQSKIMVIRGEKIMLDRDLAGMYGVSTKALNQAVTRNIERFPPDFMFRLAPKEKDELVTNCDRFHSLKHSSVMPRAFTEQGVAMLSSVLKSQRAVEVNILIMRAFVKLRQMAESHKDLFDKISEMEKKYDEQFRIVFEAIRQLMTPEIKPKKRIGFEVKEPKRPYGKRTKRINKKK